MTAPDGSDPTTREWALFAYICGDNPRIAVHAQAQIDGILKFTGSPHLHVAVQWDLPDGAERAVFNEFNAWDHEELHAVNTGDPDAFVSFLRWAFDRCPSEHVIVVASGTGLLDPRASMGGPDNDRAHLFTVCDDAGAGDALSLSEIRRVLRRAVDATSREQIDIVALDMRELQCLEVAYEIEGLAQVLIAPQTRVPDSGWNFELVLRELDSALKARGAGDPMSVHDMARFLVKTVGAAYQATRHGELSLSALDLGALKGVASAFDTLSLAMVHSVGEELVWKARETVATRLKPSISTATIAVDPSSPEAEDANDIDIEIEYLYDLVQLLGELRKEFRQGADSGLTLLLLGYLSQLDASGFQRALQSIDDASFNSKSRLRVPAMQSVIPDPPTTRRRLKKLIKFARDQARTWSESRRGVQNELVDVLTHPSLKPATAYSWIEEWPDDTIDKLEPLLAAQYRTARRQQQRLRHLAALTDRVLHLLTGAADERTGQLQAKPLVIEHFMSGGATRHGGVSLFRPRELDQLIDSDYLSLRFNQKIHWTVLLAVINLIGSHPRALWRILSAVLATADNSTRAELIDRIAGPGSVVAPFREQFVVLAPAKAFVLTLEPDPNATRATASHRTASHRRPSTEDSPGPQAYRVRLELADRDAFISEVTSIVDPEALADVIDDLVELMKSEKPVGTADVRRLESLGKTLGEDILQSLGEVLSDSADASRERIHLQLQLPRDLMGYPWELMHHKGGWLAEDFALGRQVFSRSIGRGLTSRMPGPLRALVIGNPPTEDVQLPYAAHEAEIIARRFAALSSETDGLIDFVRERDARINQEITRGELRELLRDGNYDIVHFAGHAVFDPKRPENSAWLLSDGPLYAQAIRNTLRWRDAQPWLVFANACEAGMDGTRPTMYQSDVFGLASAFLDNGVSVFIGPLWRIDDTIAASVALTFYEQLLGERQTVGEALRYAKVEAKKRHFDISSAPGTAVQAERVARVSWAGLVLYGNSTATIGQRVGAPALNTSGPQAEHHAADDEDG